MEKGWINLTFYAGRPRQHVISAYLEHASEGENEARTGAYEEDGGNVETERNGSIGKEDKGADAGKLVEWSEALCEGKDGEVDDGADGGIVVQRNERVHLEPV